MLLMIVMPLEVSELNVDEETDRRRLAEVLVGTFLMANAIHRATPPSRDKMLDVTGRPHKGPREDSRGVKGFLRL